MAIHIGGKPGSRQVTGIQLAQIKRIAFLSRSLLLLNNKLANLPIPIIWINNNDAIALAQASIVWQQYAVKKN